MNLPDSPENDPLDDLLREQNSHIDDNGFTARVLAQLPARRRSVSVRSLVLLCSSIVGCLCLFLWPEAAHLPALNWSALVDWNLQSLMPWVGFAAVVLAIGFSAMNIVQVEDER